MHNPRQNPKSNVGCGEHAISLGAKKLGDMLSKCASEVALVESLPPGHPQATMVLGLLKTNLQKIMGIIQGADDDE